MSSTLLDENQKNEDLILIDSGVDQDQEQEAVATKKKKRAARNRKFRPEDERTLKIITEKFRAEKTGMVCQVEKCTSKPMQCSKTSNLKRHLSMRHPHEYKKLFPHEVDSKKQAELESFNAIQDAIELVTVNGYPFSMLSSSGMRGFINSRLQAIRPEGNAIPIDRYSIMKHVAEESDLIRKFIAADLKGKKFSIMFDVCTISTLSMLGVNATRMKGEDVVCYSLGTIKIEERHTSVNLAAMLFEILAGFDLSIGQVFSITSDTAKNATATSEILNLVASNGNVEDSIFDDDDGLEFESEFGLDIENELELQKVIQNINAHTQLVEEMSKGLKVKNRSIVLINQINCCTHVFQLAVNNALEESDSKNTVEKVHDMCVLMRTQIVMIAIRKLGSKVILPPLDNATRWNSKFTMVIILIFLEFIIYY